MNSMLSDAKGEEMPEKKLAVIEVEQSALKTSLITETIQARQVNVLGGRFAPRPCVARVGDGTVAFEGNGDVALLCGKCGATLARNIRRGQLWQVVLMCGNRLAFNDTKGCGQSNAPFGQAIQL